MIKEAFALKLLNIKQAPRLVFFDQDQPIKSHLWIIESYVRGSTVKRLTLAQFKELGKVLAALHGIKDPKRQQLNVWNQFLFACRAFGDEEQLLNHVDPRLKALVIKGRMYMQEAQHLVNDLEMCLIHADATPSNILVDGETINLIDWEFACFSDPMREFSTIYYDDIEYNQGKWRIKIEPEEKEALFAGYQAVGGQINADRITFWMNFDKLGAAVFLYWRIHQSELAASAEQMQQYHLDLANLLGSLEERM